MPNDHAKNNSYGALKKEVNEIFLLQAGHHRVRYVEEIPEHRLKYIQFLQVVIQQLDEHSENFVALYGKSDKKLEQFKVCALKGFIMAAIELINSTGSQLQIRLTELVEYAPLQSSTRDLKAALGKIKYTMDCVGAAGNFFQFITHGYSIASNADLARNDPFQAACVIDYDYFTWFDKLKDIKAVNDRRYAKNQNDQRILNLTMKEDENAPVRSKGYFGWFGSGKSTASPAIKSPDQEDPMFHDLEFTEKQPAIDDDMVPSSLTPQ